MEDFLESPDDKLVVEVPKEKRYLNTASYDFSIHSLVEFMSQTPPKIILEVPFQRNFIWKEDRASQLIESVVMNVPIPPLYFAEEESGRWLVIDGLQRLNSLLTFSQNEFPLQDLEIIKELEGKKYKDLPPKAKSLLEDGLMRVNVIKKDSHSDIKYDIFMRLNKGSVSLNYQELRNCLYRGNLNNAAREYSNTNRNFQKILNLKKPHIRFLDVELIMRVFALEEKLKKNEQGEYFIEGYNGRMVNFINDYMESTKDMSKEDSNLKLTKFSKTIEKVVEIFGTDNPLKDTTAKIQRFNKAIAELIFISFSMFTLEELKDLEIPAFLHQKLTENDDFKKSTSQNTSNKEVVNYRINYWLKALEDAI
jgi:uncharacterized protein with ParB-like and HNH nuclease domain